MGLGGINFFLRALYTHFSKSYFLSHPPPFCDVLVKKKGANFECFFSIFSTSQKGGMAIQKELVDQILFFFFSLFFLTKLRPVHIFLITGSRDTALRIPLITIGNMHVLPRLVPHEKNFSKKNNDGIFSVIFCLSVHPRADVNFCSKIVSISKIDP